MTTQPEALRLADALEKFEGDSDYEFRIAREAASELRRLHDVNKELGAAIRRLIGYCSMLEMRHNDGDGEHPALQQAKEALAMEGV